ncbi:MAG: zf-HC2 domain-containing protein [Acidobacteriaceae bacterium]|jgi:anti-sigma factor RsiW|nr:zf-HC2 domain-containing protein [Acidobacteriaceae bacterium]
MMWSSESLSCKQARGHFSAYLDGAVSGTVMQSLEQHLSGCEGCNTEFAQWRAMQNSLASLGPAKAPPDLALRLRVALSQRGAPDRITALDRLQLAWKNTLAPLALQASAGLASALVMLGAVVLLLGVASAPEQAIAADDPTGATTAPRFLYASSGSDTQLIESDANGQPIVVQAYVSANGDVYDFRVVSGYVNGEVRAQLANKLLFSKFVPATVFDQPTRGRVLLSYTGISVRG